MFELEDMIVLAIFGARILKWVTDLIAESNKKKNKKDNPAKYTFMETV